MNTDEIEQLESDRLAAIRRKNARYNPVIVSDCCHADTSLVNSPVAGVEAVWCEACKLPCNAISEE